MKKVFEFLIIATGISVIAVILLVWFLQGDLTISNSGTTELKSSTPSNTHIVAVAPKKTKIILDVPFILEAPDDVWVGSWKNACEEASIAMVEKFYAGEKTVSIAEAKTFMQSLFDAQNELYGSDVNADADRVVSLIDSYTSYSGRVVSHPTIEDIRQELIAGRPVISFHYGFALKNENIPFRVGGTSFHVIVIIGFDDNKKQFITNDDGDSISGKGHTYDYDLFMSSLRDYNFVTKQTDIPARVVFTNPQKK